jgi:hypothetical protein
VAAVAVIARRIINRGVITDGAVGRFTRIIEATLRGSGACCKLKEQKR